MENSELLDAICSYCKNQNFQKTLKALYRATDITNKDDEAEEDTVVKIFQKCFKIRTKRDGLSFTFNLSNKRSQLRKRLLDIDHRPVGTKKMKVIKTRKNDIPEMFFLLLDELGLDKKEAQLLYENKDQWSYVKSDMKLYCAVSGK